MLRMQRMLEQEQELLECATRVSRGGPPKPLLLQCYCSCRCPSIRSIRFIRLVPAFLMLANHGSGDPTLLPRCGRDGLTGDEPIECGIRPEVKE